MKADSFTGERGDSCDSRRFCDVAKQAKCDWK